MAIYVVSKVFLVNNTNAYFVTLNAFHPRT
jgi:hypothetical protein